MNGVRTHNLLVVIGTDCIGSCKSNYRTIMTTATPWFDDVSKKHENWY